MKTLLLRGLALPVLLAVLFMLGGCDKLGFKQPTSNALGNRPDLD